MDECSKAIPRRKQDWRFANRWLVGRGLDVGCGPDPLKKEDWPKVSEIVPYDVALGNVNAQFLPEIKDSEFDFLHSSHCLEHLSNPRAALVNWLRVVKPGGFVVCSPYNLGRIAQLFLRPCLILLCARRPRRSARWTPRQFGTAT